jgi:hypothetical protein
MATYHEIFKADNQKILVQGEADGVNSKRIPPELFTITDRVVSDSGTFVRVNGNRALALRVAKSAPSKRVNLKGAEEVAVKLVTVKENHHYEIDRMQGMIDFNTGEVNDRGQAEIGRQTNTLVKRAENSRVVAAVSALGNGKVWFNSEGELLASATGASTTIDYKIPANNLGQLNGLIAVSWDDAAADLGGQISNIISKSNELTGYEITTVFYGKDIYKHVKNNTYLKNMYQNADPLAQQLYNSTAGIIPNGLFGLNWVPLGNVYFMAEDGTMKNAFPADACCFTPDIMDEWWGYMEGTTVVPNDVAVASTATDMLANTTVMDGRYGFATIETDPLAIKQVVGDVFLPIIKVPRAVFIADCVFT